MKFILGTKENMSEYFSEDGTVVPVTIVSAGPVKVVTVKAGGKDGYNSIQVGFGEQKKHRVNKAQVGQMKGDLFKVMKEFRLKAGDKFEGKEGEMIDVSIFNPGDKLQVSGTSKGKGFQGVVKRHGFHGGPRTHGQKHSEREPGSIGGGLRTHVPKGMRMAGRMGSDRITQKNLKVVAIDKDTNTMMIEGAVPGRRGSLLEIISR
jgi:large subunit ribosomal protein L3